MKVSHETELLHCVWMWHAIAALQIALVSTPALRQPGY